MLQPKKTKFRRQQKGRQKGNAQRGNQLAFGSFGIKALETKWITGRQIEAARIAVTRYMQRQGQIWIRIFPDKPITRKPADVRMGKGKGLSLIHIYYHSFQFGVYHGLYSGNAGNAQSRGSIAYCIGTRTRQASAACA